MKCFVTLRSVINGDFDIASSAEPQNGGLVAKRLKVEMERHSPLKLELFLLDWFQIESAGLIELRYGIGHIFILSCRPLINARNIRATRLQWSL